MTLLLPSLRPGFQPATLSVPWDATKNEYGRFFNGGGTRACTADLGCGKCCNAFCPLGILGTPTGDDVRPSLSGASSPCSEEYVAQKFRRPTTLFLPQHALVYMPAPDVGADIASEGLDAAYGAPKPSASSDDFSLCSAQPLCSRVAPASSASVRIPRFAMSSRSPWNSPPSTGRLLMVDWTPPGAFSNKSECREDFFSAAPSKKRRKTEETIPSVPAAGYTASGCTQQIPSAAAAGDRPKTNGIARSSQARSETTVTSFENKQLFLNEKGSRAAHLIAVDLPRPDAGFPYLRGVPTKARSTLWEKNQPLRIRVAQRKNTMVPGTSAGNLQASNIPLGTTALRGLGPSSGNHPGTELLYEANETPNCFFGIRSGAAFANVSRISLAGSEEDKLSQLVLHDQSETGRALCNRVSRTVVPSCSNVSNLHARLVSDRLQARLIHHLQTSRGDTVRNPQPGSSRDAQNLQAERLPGTRSAFVTPAKSKNGETRQVKPPLSAHVEAHSTERDVSTLLSLLLWPYNVGPYQFHPAVLKAIYAEWMRLHRGKGAVHQQQ